MIQYIVEKGDSLWKIAKAYNISLDSLIAANPQITDPNFILIGSVINIPEHWQNWPTENNDRTMPMAPGNDNQPMSVPNRKQTRQTLFNQPMPPLNSNQQMPQMPYNYGNQPMPQGPQMPGPNWPNMTGSMPICDESGMRPCIYEAMEGETLEQISNKYMVPLTRLLYHNLNYGKNEPLPAGTRIVIPEGNAQMPSQPTAYSRYRRR